MFNPLGNNPLMMLYQAMRMGQNPMAVMQQNAQRDPQIGRAMSMIQGKTPQQLEQMARNMAREKGIDIESAIRQMGL